MIRRRFKYFMPERNEFSTTGEETLLSVSEYYGVKPRSEAFDADAAEGRALSLEGYRKVKAGDFVMNYMLAWKGAYGVSEHEGIVSPAYAVFKINPHYADRRFIHHRLRSEHMRSAFRARSKGIIESRLRLYPDAFLSMDLNLPDLETQEAIADFLDRETVRIDQLIEKKKRLVELLSSRRQSFVSSLVMRGFNTNDVLVATNSKFLPKCPKHWTIQRLKHLGRLRGGLTLGRNLASDIETISLPYLRVANVQAGWLDLSDVAEIDVSKVEATRYRLNMGDVLMNEGGDNDKLGRGAVWKEQIPVCLNQNHVFVFTPNDKFYSDWVSLSTNADYAREFFFLHSNQSTNLASISKTNCSEFPVPIPPKKELQELLIHASATLETISESTRKVRCSIEHLGEYRSALITAAVTGQIDVATWSETGEADRRLDQIQEVMG